MALIKCPKCGKEISDKAKNCVKCGWKVDLNELKQEEKLDSCQSDFKTDSLNVENERKKMLKEAEFEIERMKEEARKEIKSMNESAEIMADRKRKDLESRLKEKEQELAKKEALLDNLQKKPKQKEKEPIDGLPFTAVDGRKKSDNNLNVFFMLLPTVIIICLGFIIWQKMDELSGKIELLALSNRTESEITASNTEETVNKELDNIIGEETIGEKDNDLEQETPDTVGEVGTEEAEIEEIGTEEGGDVEEGNVETDISNKKGSVLEVSCDVRDETYRLELVFTVKNISGENISLLVDDYQYINDVSVENYGLVVYNNEIPAGKATIVKFPVQKEDISSTTINKIEFGCTSYDLMGNEVKESFLFDNLNKTFE